MFFLLWILFVGEAITLEGIFQIPKLDHYRRSADDSTNEAAVPGRNLAPPGLMLASREGKTYHLRRHSSVGLNVSSKDPPKISVAQLRTVRTVVDFLKDLKLGGRLRFARLGQASIKDAPGIVGTPTTPSSLKSLPEGEASGEDPGILNHEMSVPCWRHLGRTTLQEQGRTGGCGIYVLDLADIADEIGVHHCNIEGVVADHITQVFPGVISSQLFGIF